MFQAWKYDYHRVTGNPVSGYGAGLSVRLYTQSVKGHQVHECGRWSLRVATSGLQCTQELAASTR